MANVFKPMMARGELNLIGATTLNEYQKYIEKDAALERRFQPVTVPEPTVAQTIMICAACATPSRRTTRSASPKTRSSRRPSCPTATSRRASCRTRRSTCSTRRPRA
ncbi:hypothetical protein ACVXG7_25435 [Enterobacter hormaechei]